MGDSIWVVFKKHIYIGLGYQGKATQLFPNNVSFQNVTSEELHSLHR